MNYIILNGVDSRTITGLLIQELPPITKPAIRTEVAEIDGRDGDIITPLGYAAYDRTLSIGLYGNFDIDAVIEFFNSSGTAIFSNESEKLYTYAIYQNIDFEKLIRFKTAEITLHVQPFKFSTAEKPLTLEPKIASGQGTSITLSPTVEGETLNSISIYGNSQQSGTPTPSNPVEIVNVSSNNTIEFYNADATQSNLYNLNLGTLELCKIGSYQDLLHQNNGVWYKRTAIKELTVNTSNITLQNYSNVVYAKIPTPSDALCYGNYKDIQCLCSHAVYSYGLNEGWNTVNAVNKIFCQADANTFWLGFPAGTTLSQIQTALNGCVIYYVLLNRLNVEISDVNLINRLNSLLQVSLYDGSTRIVIDSTPAPTISITAIINAFIVKNTGNIYSRPKITIYGNNNVTVSVNGLQIFTIDLSDTEYITIDGALMEAYQDTTDNLKNRLVTGDYENFILNIGTNTLSFSNNVTQVVIENYSRWI